MLGNFIHDSVIGCNSCGVMHVLNSEFDNLVPTHECKIVFYVDINVVYD